MTLDAQYGSTESDSDECLFRRFTRGVVQFRCVEVSETNLDPFSRPIGLPDAQAVAIPHVPYRAGEGRAGLLRERAFAGIGRG